MVFLMKKIICLIMLLLVIPFTCQAHEIMGYMPNRTKAFTKAIEKYYKDKYGLKLHTKLEIIVTEKTSQYENILKILNLYDYLTYDTFAVTENNTILINGDHLMDRHFYSVLAHEMTHKYQEEYWDDLKGDYIMLEGLADIIANDISGYIVDIEDHGIPYEDLKTEKGYKEHVGKDSCKTAEQVRYYAKQSPGFLSKCRKK